MSFVPSTYSKLDYASALTNTRDSAEGPPRRNYDMCMVFKYKTSRSVKYEERGGEFHQRTLGEPSEAALHKMQGWTQQRESILKNLNSCGLHLFCFYSRDRDEIIVKVGAGAQKLRDTAQRMKYKIQLKEQYLNAYAEYRNDFPGRPERHFRDRRVISHIYKTHHNEDFSDSDAIFRTVDKIKLINHVIISKDKDCAGINVGNLLFQDLLRAYFPLHEPHALNEIRDNKVQWFLTDMDWATTLGNYFGCKIAFYFLFLGFYWKWLLPIAGLGLVLTLIDLFALTSDNITAIPFCLLMSIWAIFMPHFWRRQESKYAIGWGTLDMQDILEPARPRFHGEHRINPVTAEVEPFYPWEQRAVSYVVSAVIMILFLIFNCGCILGLLLYRHHSNALFLGGGLSFQFLVAFFVEIMNTLLAQVAGWRTQVENHRTQTEHDRFMLFKVILLKFVNSYFILYYIAFFKSHKYLFGEEMKCVNEDCFMDLQSQLGVFIVFRLTCANVAEHFGPKISHWVRTWRSERQSLTQFFHGNQRLEFADLSVPEAQAKKERYDTFVDFSEQLITHGYCTFFALCAPWTCAVTLVGVLLEVLVDMNSLIESRQRPVPLRARDNEPWSTAFDIFGFIGANTNICLLIFSSHEYANWTLSEKLTFLLYLEHVLLLLRLVLNFVFPRIPDSVQLLHLKQETMVHRALENIKVDSEGQDFSMFRDHRNDNIQVHEHDYMEEQEDGYHDEEPHLHLKQDATAMVVGVFDAIGRDKDEAFELIEKCARGGKAKTQPLASDEEDKENQGQQGEP